MSLPPRPGAAAEGSSSVEKHNVERRLPIIPPSSKREANGADEVAGTEVTLLATAERQPGSRRSDRLGRSSCIM